MKKGNGCNLCTHPSCPHGQLNLGVSACPECDGGVLVGSESNFQVFLNFLYTSKHFKVLDPASNPKWRLVCNKCDVVVKLFEDAVKVSLKFHILELILLLIQFSTNFRSPSTAMSAVVIVRPSWSK
jgi:DNA topoisomerase-3